MLARNSIGRRVSLLNDESSTSKGAAKTAAERSTSLSSLPSISSFYSRSSSANSNSSSSSYSSSNNSSASSPRRHQHQSRRSKPSFSFSGSQNHNSGDFRTHSDYATSTTSTLGDHSPTLSNCSTEFEPSSTGVSAGNQYHKKYSPEYYLAQNSDNTKSLPILSSQKPSTSSAATASETDQYHHHNNHQHHHPQRPAGPAPLLINTTTSTNTRRDNSESYSGTSNESSLSNSNIRHSHSSESNISFSSRNQSSKNNSSSGGPSTSSSSLLLPPLLPSLSSSATTNNSTHNDQHHHHLQQRQHSLSSSNINRRQHLLHPVPSLSWSNSTDSNTSSRSTSSNQLPSTPPTPTSLNNNSSTSILTTKKMMDHQSKTNIYPTMLSSPTVDTFFYGGPMNTGMNQRNSITGQYFSVAQQPLPPPVTATSPIMYNTLESPNSLVMMDPYLPLQQQSMPSIPFAPYPTELIPGAMPLQSQHQPQLQSANQSIVATSPSDTSNNSAPKMAKKKYPCPHAVKYNCSDTFTTSGHAARHGKKHTGEKNIHCPVCDKAFTRKDNMKQHERTHRNKGEASKVAEAVESSKRSTAKHQSSLSKSSTNSSTEVEMEDVSQQQQPLPPTTPKRLSDPQASIRAANQQRRPTLTSIQPSVPPTMTSPTAVDVPMPVTLDSNETLQPVAPSLYVEPMDKNFTNIFDSAFTSRSQETLLGRPAIFERTTSTGSGFSADGEGESPGLDALAMAAELS